MSIFVSIYSDFPPWITWLDFNSTTEATVSYVQQRDYFALGLHAYISLIFSCYWPFETDAVLMFCMRIDITFLFFVVYLYHSWGNWRPYVHDAYWHELVFLYWFIAFTIFLDRHMLRLLSWISVRIARPKFWHHTWMELLANYLFFFRYVFKLPSFVLIENILTFHVIFQNGKQMVQEGALTALASVADSSQVTFLVEVQYHLQWAVSLLWFLISWPWWNNNILIYTVFQDHFKKYYDAVMPYLKAILMNATDKSNRMLRAKSMECISLVGMAVGKDKFRDDAKQVSIPLLIL